MSAFRILVALVALYGVALSGTLGAAAAAFLSTHDGAICRASSAPQHDAGKGDNAPLGHRHSGDCCLSTAPAGSAVAPSLVALDLGWPTLSARRATWPRERSITLRGPPEIAAHPRAPPAFGPTA